MHIMVNENSIEYSGSGIWYASSSQSLVVVGDSWAARIKQRAAQELFEEGFWNNNINSPIPREDFPYPTPRLQPTSAPPPPASQVPPPPPPVAPAISNPTPPSANDPAPPTTNQPAVVPSSTSVPSETNASFLTSASLTASSTLSTTISGTGTNSGTTFYATLASSTSRPTEHDYVSLRSFTAYSIRTTSMLSPNAAGSPPNQPIRLSQAAIALLLSVGGVFFLLFSAVIVRCIRMQIRRHRRKARDNAFDQGSLSEKGSNGGETGSEAGGGGKPKARSLFSKSPSSLFGGRERTGLTPLPSWTTFQEAGSCASSPYPLGLVPPPTSAFHHLPSTNIRQQIGLGVIHPGMHIPKGKKPAASEKALARKHTLAHPPPMITITSSSPRQTAHSHQLSDNPPTVQSHDISPSNSFNRVSIYTHPKYGAQLVKPPKLILANGEAETSGSGESVPPIRASGWSSWDDNIGVELGGMTIDRMIADKRQGSSTRSKVTRNTQKRGVILDSITESPDVVGSRTSRFTNDHSPRFQTLQRTQLRPNSSHRLRRGTGSTLSTKSSVRSPRSPNAKRRQQQQHDQFLYDVPHFDALSPNVKVNDSFKEGERGRWKKAKRTSWQSSRNSRDVLPLSDSMLATPGSHSQWNSKRSSRTSSKRTSALTYTPPSVNLSQAVMDAYAYANAFGDVSEGPSEEAQAKGVVKRKSASMRNRPHDHLPRAQTTPVLGTSPNPHSRVGTLMLTDYREEGNISKGVSSPVITKGILMKKQQHGILDHLEGLQIRQPFENVSSVGEFGSRSSLGRPVSDASKRIAYAEGDESRRPVQLPTPAFSDQSYYSNGIDPGSPAYRHQIQSQFRDVPSLPPPGGPTLHQLRMMNENPDYRSPTYSMYGFYRDSSRVSPLQDSSSVEYRRQQYQQQYQQSQAVSNATIATRGSGVPNPMRYLPPSQVIKP